MRQNKGQQQNWFRIFIVSAIFLVSTVGLWAQDPCDTKKEFDDATREAKSAEHKKTKPSEPTDDRGAKLTKPTDKALEQAKEAKDKVERTTNEDESALRQATEAMTKFKNDFDRGRKLATLKSEIATLESNIKKAEQAAAKVSEDDKNNLENFKQKELTPLQAGITKQMPGLSLEDAKEKVNDASYEGFSNDEIDAIRAEIKRNQEVIKTMNSKYGVGSSVNPTAGDDEQIQKAQAAIITETAKLKTAIEECRKKVIEDLKPLRDKQLEYNEKLKKLYPVEETRDLITSLPKWQEELAAKKKEAKPLSDEEQKLQNEAKQAKEKFEGGTKDGKSLTGSKQTYEDVEKKVNDLEKDLKKFEDYATKKKEWDESEEKKSKAEEKIKGKKTDYDKIEAAKNTVLTRAKTLAALDTLETRLATVNEKLMAEAKKEVLENDSKVGENKKKLEQALKAAQNEEQKAKIRQRWKDYITKKTQPHYIRKRNKAEADRLQAIRDHANVQKFKCFKDMEDFINLLGQTMNEVMARTASLVSDMDSGLPEGADEQIPIGEIPPLDEGEGGDNPDSPTDEVPDDIAKNTGEVKVIQYFVFLLTNSSNGLYVGSEDSIKGRTRCSFVGGGIGCKAEDVISYKKLLGPFASQAEAQEGLCKSITESRHFPLGVGLKGRWQGGSNWYGLWDASISGCAK